MTALVAVASYLPGEQVPIETFAPKFGLTDMQIKVFRRYHKLGNVRRDPQGTLMDLLRGALSRLDALKGQEHLVRYVIHPRTFPVVVPFPMNPVHEVCQEFGLTNAEAFAISHQACSSGLQALDLAGRLLSADGDPDAMALVLAGEKAFTGESQMIPETSFFGEGASACLVRDTGPRDRMLSYAAMLRGEFDGELEEVAGEFQSAYADSLADAVLAAIAEAGLSVEDIRIVLPHNVNVVAWQRVSRRIKFPLDRVILEHVATNGHVFCADAFINYQTAVAGGMLTPGDRYVVAAAGAGRGATFSAMVFEH
ncbi:3-oxoacyl-[acyl-carrier-protein] synthase III C-terminal domain-containing protein [Catelliglobosispora koreensis]|uniref:3-oxoacyl-[acyl-carrier-protein] synthase III C-terminal domain-containing protein n=1 Tax=Catelliglobosispora koreensis TaxID=129052 RepID=UPI00039E8A87|nr:3-oxoacyl-[acyl-carrier-protein] synthase III C-terminal domain-containing protein [Catelliglobosispora koreensis]